MTKASTGDRASVHVRGSTTLLVSTQKAAEAYMVASPTSIITVAGSGTVRGVRAVIQGTADLALASAEIDDENRKLAQRAGVALATYPLAADALVPCVHLSNPISSLTMDQLHDIYIGDMVNWSEAGAPDGRVQVLVHDPQNGHGESWRALVLGEESLTPRAAILDRVSMRARLAKDRWAIGYLAHTEVDSTVKPLAVEGVVATPESIITGEFKLRRRLMAVTLERHSDAVASFVAYLRDPDKGMRFVVEAGNVPPRR